MEGRRNHVLGQRLTELVPQHVGIEWPLARVEGHQVLAVVGPLGDHDFALADARQPQECVLDLADLYPEATDLDLRISTAEKLQLAFGQPAAKVTAPVQPLALAVRIGQERASRAVGIIDIPAADTHSGENDLTGRAERRRCQVLVHDIDVDIVDGAAKRNTFSAWHAVHDLVVGIVGGLGQPVRIHQLDPRLDCKPALHQLLLQRLARGRHAPQVRQLAGVPPQTGYEGFEVGRHDLNDGHPALDDPVDETLRVEDRFLLYDQSPPADQKGGNQLPQRDVKG